MLTDRSYVTLEYAARSASWILWLGRGMFLVVILALVLMRSVVTIIKIDGHSMDPTLQNGQWVVVDMLSKHWQDWRFGEMAILRFPGDPLHSLYVKRVIGVPGDQVYLDSGRVVRNGIALQESYLDIDSYTADGLLDFPEHIPDGQFLVLGDNRSISNDSRYFGLVPQSDMVGKVVLY